MKQENIKRLIDLYKHNDLTIEYIEHKDNKIIVNGRVSHINERAIVVNGVVIAFNTVTQLNIDKKYMSNEDKLIIHLHETHNEALNHAEELLGITYDGIKEIFEL